MHRQEAAEQRAPERFDRHRTGAHVAAPGKIIGFHHIAAAGIAALGDRDSNQLGNSICVADAEIEALCADRRIT